MLGALVGLTAEAKLLRARLPHCAIAVSGATREGAERGIAALKRAGATQLLSFGCAAGLSPLLKPGTILVPDWVDVDGRRFQTDLTLRNRFGAEQAGAKHGGLRHSDDLIVTAADKALLFAETHCLGVDMESGLVAQAGLPFAVLRVICDDVARDLPPVAQDVLAEGRISIPRLLSGLARKPNQIGALMALGREAGIARKAMKSFLRRVH